MIVLLGAMDIAGNLTGTEKLAFIDPPRRYSFCIAASINGGNGDPYVAPRHPRPAAVVPV
jgi:hypothetical protein